MYKTDITGYIILYAAERNLKESVSGILQLLRNIILVGSDQ